MTAANPAPANEPDGHYDPFVRGRFPVGVRTTEVQDASRNRRLPCEVWYPAAAACTGGDLCVESQDTFPDPMGGSARRQAAVRNAEARSGSWPFVVFSHSSGGGRRQSTFLCTHLSSHGYVVAAVDHSEAVAPELAARPAETDAERAARQVAWMANRVPDVRALLDDLPARQEWMGAEWSLDAERFGIVGHSFGGWTALAAPEVEDRLRVVVALAPAGGANPKPGILKARLSFSWGRDVPTTYVVGAADVSLPIAGMLDLYERTPATKQLFALRGADHMHFMDRGEQLHEAVRAMSFPGPLAWLPGEMRPIAELCSGEHAEICVRGLTLCQLDAVLGPRDRASAFLSGPVDAALEQLGIDVQRP